MRRAIYDRWSATPRLHLCSCGALISQSESAWVGQPVVVDQGCHERFERWMRRRIARAEELGMWNSSWEPLKLDRDFLESVAIELRKAGLSAASPPLETPQ